MVSGTIHGPIEGVVLHVVSLDIIIDEHYGDLSRKDIQQYWLHGIRCGWVHAFLGGPPCCTWSKARAVDLDDGGNGRPGRFGPRPVRSAQDLWGLTSLGLREIDQVIDGNVLLGFCLVNLLYKLGLASLSTLQNRLMRVCLPFGSCQSCRFF